MSDHSKLGLEMIAGLRKYIDLATQRVESKPEWKRDILARGVQPTVSPRQPVDNFAPQPAPVARRIEVLPIGTKVRLKGGTEGEVSYAEVCFYGDRDHTAYVVDQRSTSQDQILEVLSRPDRTITIVIEELTK